MTEENTPEVEVEEPQVEASQEQVTDTEESESSSEEVAETQEERLYAGKYKTVEEMEKGYKNLESKLGQPQPAPEVYQPKPQPTRDEILAPLADENGNIDPMKLVEYAENSAVERVRNEQRAKDFEQEDWTEAVKAHPELNEDTPESKKLAALIRTKRRDEIISGQGYRPYKEVAKEIVGLFTTAKKEGQDKGREEAQVSERIVDRSSLLTPNNNSDSGVTEEQTLLKEIGSLDHEVARQARLKYLEKYN